MNTVSLLIPCYNAENYLPRLWETIEEQTVPFDEIICYDDGSTDNTVAVATALGAKVIGGSERKGPAYARNRLAEAASGTWIHFHDADDILHPHYLEKVKTQTNQDVDVIICNADWIDEKSWLLRKEYNIWIARHYKDQDLKYEPLKATLINPIGVISTLCRRKTFLDLNGFNERYTCWEDGDFHVRLAAAGARFTVVEEVLAYSLRHNRGISAQSQYCNRCRLELLEEYAKEFGVSLHETIASQLEGIASAMIICHDYQYAKQALRLCKNLGAHPPTSNNIIIRILKNLLSPLSAMRIQMFIRKSPVVFQGLNFLRNC